MSPIEMTRHIENTGAPFSLKDYIATLSWALDFMRVYIPSNTMEH